MRCPDAMVFMRLLRDAFFLFFLSWTELHGFARLSYHTMPFHGFHLISSHVILVTTQCLGRGRERGEPHDDLGLDLGVGCTNRTLGTYQERMPRCLKQTLFI